MFRGKLMLVNWKKMKRYVSSVEKTFDFPLQVAAYIGAINYDDSYPFQVWYRITFTSLQLKFNSRVF